MRILLYYLILINLVTFVIYGADKWKAKAGKRRVPEKTLLVLTLIGGSVGALFAMLLFRHKTRKLEFVISVPVLLVVHCVLVAAAVWYWPGG